MLFYQVSDATLYLSLGAWLAGLHQHQKEIPMRTSMSCRTRRCRSEVDLEEQLPDGSRESILVDSITCITVGNKKATTGHHFDMNKFDIRHAYISFLMGHRVYGGG